MHLAKTWQWRDLLLCISGDKLDNGGKTSGIGNCLFCKQTASSQALIPNLKQPTQKKTIIASTKYIWMYCICMYVFALIDI